MRGIPSILLDKIKQQYQTKFNNANPRVSVTVARARTTVSDSSYFTVETIREGANLGDVSLAPQRMRVSGTPTRIYEIHVDNGIVGTSIREYPDKLKDGWKDQFSLGAGSKVAMAFDGEWKRYRQLWRLVTHEKPWIFWTNTSNTLYAQLWDDTTTTLELSTNVTYVRAIRGWKNVNLADLDQGIVVGYIKSDGKVYYRNYCQQIDHEYIWENERELTGFTGTAVSLNLFITNDYRMGFMIEDSLGSIHWLITGRNWAGMAVAPEYIEASIGGSIDLVYITKIPTYETEYIQASVGGELQFLYALSDNSFRSLVNIPITMIDENEEEYQNYGFRIYVKLEHDLTELDYLNFTLVDENSTAFVVTGVSKVGRRLYLFETADFNNAYGDLTLTFLGSGSTKGEAGQNADSFIGTFTPENLVPTFIPLPEVEVIWNE